MMIYKSKVGFWAYFYIAFFLVLTVYFWSTGDLLAGTLFTGVSALSLWFFLNIRYVLTQEELVIRPFGPSIPLKDITAVDAQGKYHFMASPALSLKRLRIKYKGSEVFVSPKDEALFVGELKARCENLSHDHLTASTLNQS